MPGYLMIDMALGLVGLPGITDADLTGNGLPMWMFCILGPLFFLTSATSVVTGSASLITVPILIEAGITPQAAIATNMFALTLVSMGATLPRVSQSKLDRQRLPWLVGLTLVSSGLGAHLLQMLPSTTLSPFLAIAMIVVAGLSLVVGDRGVHPLEVAPSPLVLRMGYLSTFSLGVYGGLFSGGYVTLLTTVLVACFGHSFLEAIVTSKAVHIFSSLIATLIFMHLGIVDYSLGLLLGIAMFLGAAFGGRVVLTLGNRRIRWLYTIAVMGLAGKLFITTLGNGY